MIPPLRAVLLALCAAAVAAPAALAKGDSEVRVADRTPRLGHPVAVSVHTGFVVPADDWLRLVVVAPGRRWYDVVGVVTGASSLAKADIPRDGFGVALRRVGPHDWRALVRIPRPGRWRIVLPNATHEGFMVPPPAAWMPWVNVHR